MAEPEWPARGAGGADVLHGPTRMPVRGATWQVRMARGGPTGIVGPSNSGGAVTQLDNNCTPQLNRAVSRYFFGVGLCPTHILPFAGDVDAWRA